MYRLFKIGRLQFKERYKMNLAVSFRPAEKLLGVGVLIRDCKGLVMAAFFTCFTACGDVLQDQARAVLIGVHHALEIGILHVEVESCFQELTGLINAGPPCLAANGVLVDDICSFFPLFQFVNFSVINSVCNKAVSALATEALSSVCDQVWLEDCPASIISLINADLVQ